MSCMALKESSLPQETGKDPITQEPLELDDLVPVKTNKAVKPRPSPATSIPGLLGLFHNVRQSPGLLSEVALFEEYFTSCTQHLSIASGSAFSSDMNAHGASLKTSTIICKALS